LNKSPLNKQTSTHSFGIVGDTFPPARSNLLPCTLGCYPSSLVV
jgi:hypothetical protein